MPALPPTMSTVPAMASVSFLIRGDGAKVVPVAREAVGVPARRLRRLGFEPPDGSVAYVAETVNAPDAGERDVARREVVGLAIEDRLRLPLQEQVRLLEGMVMRTSDPGWLVLDHEHRG